MKAKSAKAQTPRKWTPSETYLKRQMVKLEQARKVLKYLEKLNKKKPHRS